MAFSRFISAHCQRPSGGGHVAIGRWPLEISGKKRKSQRKERKKQAFIYPIARHLPPHAGAKRNSVFSEKKCTASCSRAYDRARKNQANTQVTFIKSLANRITFQAYLEFLQTAITENVPYACDGVRHIFFIDIFRISCDSDSR